MDKLSVIIDGWKNSVFGMIPEVKEEATRRSKICAKCDFLVESNVIQKSVGLLAGKSLEEVKTKCGSCGCPTHAIVASMLKKCPENFFDKRLDLYALQMKANNEFASIEKTPCTLSPMGNIVLSTKVIIEGEEHLFQYDISKEQLLIDLNVATTMLKNKIIKLASK